MVETVLPVLMEVRLQRLIRAVELRSIVKMLREPDQVVDHLLASFIPESVRTYTGSWKQAQAWAALVAPDLYVIGHTRLINGLCRADTRVEGRPYGGQFLANHPAIPLCVAALSRYIDVLLESLTKDLTQNADPGT